jgi:AcrR family transcriptional regulator
MGDQYLKASSNSVQAKPNLRAAQKTQTRRLILDTSLRLFQDVGFYGTTVDRIAGEIGCSRAAFYLHFPDKEAVLHALILAYLARAVDQLARLPGPFPTRDEIDRWMGELVEFFKREHASVTVFATIGSMRPDMPQFLESSSQTLTDALGRNIPAFASGSLRANHEVERRVAADSLIVQITWAGRSAAHRTDKAYGDAALNHAASALFNFIHDPRFTKNKRRPKT